RLVVVGSGPEEAKLRRLAGPDVVFTGTQPASELCDLYSGAQALLFPGEEDFGITPLEAMACGTAVIATKTGAIPEFAGDAALLVNPGDREALREAVLTLLASRNLREELAARGAERATHYRWDRSAKLMTELLAEAAR
ncbi:MAG TPA: glycosyltransferase, partial [Thermoanaerobaculia bacterium]|nr:glycosyltransferase [Thermoanaerobaculia bacterium]